VAADLAEARPQARLGLIALFQGGKG